MCQGALSKVKEVRGVVGAQLPCYNICRTSYWHGGWLSLLVHTKVLHIGHVTKSQLLKLLLFLVPMFFGRGWSGAAAVHGRCVWLCCHTLLTFKFYKLNPESSVLFSFSWFREVWTLQSWRLLDSPLLCGATYAGGYGDCDLQLETRLGGENFIVPQYFFLASLAAFSRWAATCPLLLNVVIDPFLVLDNRESPVETFILCCFWSVLDTLCISRYSSYFFELSVPK